MARNRGWYGIAVVSALLSIPRSAFAQSADATPAPPTTPVASSAESPAPSSAPDAAAHLMVILDAEQHLSVTHRDAQGNVVWRETAAEESDPIAALLLTWLLTISAPHERAAPPPSTSGPRSAPHRPSRPTLPAAYEPPDALSRRGALENA